MESVQPNHLVMMEILNVRARMVMTKSPTALNPLISVKRISAKMEEHVKWMELVVFRVYVPMALKVNIVKNPLTIASQIRVSTKLTVYQQEPRKEPTLNADAKSILMGITVKF